MNDAIRNERATRGAGGGRSARITVASFLLVLWLPLVMSGVQGERRVSDTENRFLAALPELGSDPSTWSKYPAKLERYYDDHIGLRTAMIRGYASLTIGLFGKSPTDTLVVGKQGWLYFGDPNAIAQYRGVAPLSEAQLARWRQVLIERRDWLASRGIAFLFVLVPDKHLMYPEYMPDRLPRVSEIHPLDQLARYLHETTDLEVLDLRAPLEAAKREARTYHRTDSHWNDYGAYVGYAAIVDRLGLILPSMSEAQPIPAARGAHVTTGMGLASIVGLASAYREERIDMSPNGARAQVAAEHRARYDERVRRMVPIALGVDDGRLPRAVMFRDSFANALVPYLAENFERIYFVWDRDVDPRVVEREQPDVVIQQVVGRFLGRRPMGIAELQGR
jgi:hypothetical protein